MPTKKINESYALDRAFYGADAVEFEGCRFESGEGGGEYALNGCGSVAARESSFSASFPLWFVKSVLVENGTFAESCRGALWYSQNVVINDSKLLGARAVRECKNVTLRDSEIVSNEFGWSTDGFMLVNDTARGDYFLRGAKNAYAQHSEFKGKYAFQYASGIHLTHCKIDSTDAFWHAEDIVLEDCVIVCERLGWFAKNVSLKRCTVVGTRPLCLCKKLTLTDCVLADADNAFEKSEVKCNLLDDVVSIRNPYKGVIVVPAVGEIIKDDPKSKAAIMIDPEMRRRPEIGT